MWGAKIGSTGSEQTLAVIRDGTKSYYPFPSDCLTNTPHVDMQWYEAWIRRQIEDQPKELFSTIANADQKDERPGNAPLGDVWHEVARHITVTKDASINDIATHLRGNGFVQSSNNSESLHFTKNLIFAIIGWQTMLYIPDFRSSPVSQLPMKDEMTGFKSTSYICAKVSNTFCKEPMHTFLRRYGMLLRPKNYTLDPSPEDEKAFKEMRTVASASFNAHFLATIGGVRIQWVDSLPCHLEFDPVSATLYLFRFPSFCLAHGSPPKSASALHQSVLHACAAPFQDSKDWATSEEVTQMFREIILTYRLLFGQHKASRRLFRGQEPASVPKDGQPDLFLATLCARKQFQSVLSIQEREVYDLEHDFPVLRSKLASLMNYLATKKPRTWKQLWQDKRDSASWLTFWAVIIIGGLGILMSFMQVVLQIIQVIKQ